MQDSFIFATTTVPKPKPTSRMREQFSKLLLSKGSKGIYYGEQGTKVPVSTLVSHGRSVGWDHTRLRWYYPIWPKFNSNLDRSLDKSTMKWILDWPHEDEAVTVEPPGMSAREGRGNEKGVSNENQL